MLKLLRQKGGQFTYDNQIRLIVGGKAMWHPVYRATVFLDDRAVQIGNGTWGKLDFLRKIGFVVLDLRVEHK